jgi:hypothetical protein
LSKRFSKHYKIFDEWREVDEKSLSRVSIAVKKKKKHLKKEMPLKVQEAYRTLKKIF